MLIMLYNSLEVHVPLKPFLAIVASVVNRIIIKLLSEINVGT